MTKLFRVLVIAVIGLVVVVSAPAAVNSGSRLTATDATLPADSNGGTYTPQPGIDGAVNLSVGDQQAQPNQLVLGVTQTQNAYDQWGDPTAVTIGRRVVAQIASIQAQHLMGWGSLNPEPSPGAYDWASLDRRIDQITADGSEPVIVLCCSPDWMKGGAAGTTDWTQLEVAPTPDHYDDFAALAAAAAVRYPAVHRFVVWNEMKGFYDKDTNNWDTDAYIALWRKVAAAVRAVRPDALIGGPYVVVDSFNSEATASNPSTLTGPWGVVDERALDVLTKFLASTDADFVAVDASATPRDGSLPAGNVFDSIGKFGAVTSWLRARTTLPIWWTEYYPQPISLRWTPDMQAAVQTDSVLTMSETGASVSLLWGPAEDGSGRPSLTTNPMVTGGGEPTPTADAFLRLRSLLAIGTPVTPLASTADAVKGWLIGTTIVVINRNAATQVVRLPDGTITSLAAWGIAFVDTSTRLSDR